jgi:regulator of cell morphogenesis and NO signaling
MRKEEEVLFPAIINLERAAGMREANGNLLPFKIANRVRLLMLEDEGTGYLLRHLRQGLLAYQPPPQAEATYKEISEAVASFESDLKRHIYVENTILFPRAIEVEKTILGD